MIELVDVYSAPDSDKILYALMRERSTEDDPHINISHRKLPPLSEHVKFVESRPYRYWYLIRVEQKDNQGGISRRGFHIVGTCYISKRNEIGIVLFKAYRGKGYGPMAVKVLIESHKPLKEIPGVRSGRFLANINPGNLASIRMFHGLGFKLMQNTYAL